MSTKSPTASPRPTLPSIQELLSDLQFDNARARSPENPRNATAIGHSPAPLFRAPIAESPARSQRTDGWMAAPPGSQLSPTAPRSPPSAVRGSSSTVPRNGPHAAIPPQLDPANPSHRTVPPGSVFDDRRHISPPPLPSSQGSGRSPSALQQMRAMNLPTYILSADECPPDDDRRHGCGICHRRFNRPSSLRIHMNSHTGDQRMRFSHRTLIFSPLTTSYAAFQCPFPGCSRRFSVNSNMRRHYRNHRDGLSVAPPSSPYPPRFYRDEPPQMLYRMNSSPESSSTMSSFSDGEDHDGSPVISPNHRLPYPFPPGRARSFSEVSPPTFGRPGPSRPRSCTLPGCNCGCEAPGALRPAFQPGSTPRFPPQSR
ncbi:hypothetical protein GY45DRAFT_297326 [Cubamyces sp. BRFM 1775]|nr:hypothetical protein GY45DRAFT_297326 [Cubamyces sp. BRFM 1775]